MQERDHDKLRADLCRVHVAIGRLRRFVELQERRGVDCSLARETISSLREQAASLVAALKHQALKVIGLFTQAPLCSDATALLLGA